MEIISDKNTEFSVDYGQIFLDSSNGKIEKVNQPNAGDFICFQIKKGGNINVAKDANQRGSSSYVNFDTKSIADGKTTASAGLVTQCENLDGTETKSTIETLFKDWYNEQLYVEISEPNERTTL